MSKKRQSYSASFKAKVALATHRQDKTISPLATQFKLHPVVLSRWKAQLLDNAADIFQDGRSTKKSDDPIHDELYQKIGRLEVELDWIKKNQKASSWATLLQLAKPSDLYPLYLPIRFRQSAMFTGITETKVDSMKNIQQINKFRWKEDAKGEDYLITFPFRYSAQTFSNQLSSIGMGRTGFHSNEHSIESASSTISQTLFNSSPLSNENRKSSGNDA